MGEVRLTKAPEQETLLWQIATHAGKPDATGLMKDVALRLIEKDHRFRSFLHEGVAAADRGDFVEENEMNDV